MPFQMIFCTNSNIKGKCSKRFKRLTFSEHFAIVISGVETGLTYHTGGTMKSIQVENDIYEHLVTNTVEIGESASSILRRLLNIRSDRMKQNSKEISKHELSDVLNEKNLGLKRNVVDRYLWLLSKIYGLRRETFREIFSLKGRTRAYFGFSKEEILKFGEASNPKLIPETKFWALTNTSTQNKARIIRDAMGILNFSPLAIQAASEFIAM
jgi:negative modulator of initiation of replication